MSADGEGLPRLRPAELLGVKASDVADPESPTWRRTGVTHLLYAEEFPPSSAQIPWMSQTTSGGKECMYLTESSNSEDAKIQMQKEKRRSDLEVFSVPHDDLPKSYDDLLPENQDVLCGQRWGFRWRPLWVKWFLTILIPVVVAVQASCMLLVEKKLSEQKFLVVQGLWDRGLPLRAALLFVGYGVACAFCAALIVVYISPHAAGSGIPSTIAFLHGNNVPGFLSFRAWLARTAALLLVTSAGLFASSEGPLLAQLGAIIASGIAHGKVCLLGHRWRLPWSFAGHRSQCEFVSMGMAVGFAGAFGSPIGGILWSLEELSFYWPRELTWRVFVGCCLAVSLVSATKGGIWRFRTTAVIDFPDILDPFQPWELLPFAAIGVATGVLGGLFCQATLWISRRRMRFFTGERPRRGVRIAEVLVISTLILLATILSILFQGCQVLDVAPAKRLEAAHQVTWMCPEGQYSDMAALLLQPKHKAMKAMFAENLRDFRGESLAIAYLVIYCALLATTGMAMPSGLFVPHIMSGACLGRAVGDLVDELVPQQVHPGVYALVGAAGQITGVSRMTVSVTVVLVEITGNMRLMLPLMLVVMVSKVVGDLFGPSAFRMLIGLDPRIHLLDDTWREESHDEITVLDICTWRVAAVRRQQSARHVLRLLQRTRFSAFPLVEGAKGHVIGSIRRHELARAVEHFSAGSADCLVDLVPYADLTPEVKNWRTPVSRALSHFQAMGLQHLFVVTEENCLLGIVTRGDLRKVCTRAGRLELCKEWEDDGR